MGEATVQIVIEGLVLGKVNAGDEHLYFKKTENEGTEKVLYLKELVAFFFLTKRK